MGYFAKIENGIVTNVIIADQEFIDAGHVEGTWLETTEGASGGIVYDPPAPEVFTIWKDGLPLRNQSIPTNKPCIRKNFCGIGYSYDATKDAFIPPKTYQSWVLDEETCLWHPPTQKPDDGKKYSWDENTISWIEVK
jgi:hypothetical protein